MHAFCQNAICFGLLYIGFVSCIMLTTDDGQRVITIVHPELLLR